MSDTKAFSCTRDAIKDIWGPRTPYKHQWPTRVDENSIEEAEHWVQSACVLCSNGCGLDIGVKNGKVVGVRGRETDRVNRGRLGPKGLSGWTSINHKDRLQYPLIRKNGHLERASWDEAMDLIVRKSKDVIERLTAHGIAFYTSGQLWLEDYYTLAVVGKAGLNTLHMDGNTRLCTATAAASMRENFGSDGQPGSYTDIDYTSCIFMVGHNMAETQTVLWSRILDRLEGPDPPNLIVVDSRLSTSAKAATIHLAPKVGTNLALLNGIQHLLLKKGLFNNDYVQAHTVNLEKLQRVVEKYPPERVEEITGVPKAKLEEVAEILGTTNSLLSTALQGVYQSNQATASACQINNINLLLGHIGKPGSGIYQMNGQPTAQNNREAGCDGEYPGFRNYSNPNHMKELADLWNIDYHKVPHWNQPTHVENILNYIKAGTIQVLWISGTNPLVSLPNLPRIRDLLTKDDLFVICQDIFLTETAALADVVLPAAQWGEKTGCFTNVDRTVHLSHKAVEPPGEAKPDMNIWVDYAKRMDFRDKDGSPLIPWETPEEAFNAFKRMTFGRPCDYSGLTYEKLTGGSGLQWPCNDDHPFGKERLFDDGIFFTDIEYCESFGHDLETGVPLSKEEYKQLNPAGRAILKECDYQVPFESTDNKYPFKLNTGRNVYHFHTRTKTARSQSLNSTVEPYVEVSEQDARRIGFEDGDEVVVESRRGAVQLKSKVTGMKPGQVFIPFHFGYFDAADGRSRAANELTSGRWDPISKQPQFKSGAVRIKTIMSAEASIAEGEAPVVVKEEQTSTQRSVQRNKRHAADFSDDSKRERYIERWLGASFEAVVALKDVYSTQIPRLTNDDEVVHGLIIMGQIADETIRLLEPFAKKYISKNETASGQAASLRSHLFPKPGEYASAYETLETLLGLQTYYANIRGHLTALNPVTQALWDAEFVDALQQSISHVDRMAGWAAHQLTVRAPQTLIVPTRMTN